MVYALQRFGEKNFISVKQLFHFSCKFASKVGQDVSAHVFRRVLHMKTK